MALSGHRRPGLLSRDTCARHISSVWPISSAAARSMIPSLRVFSHSTVISPSSVVTNPESRPPEPHGTDLSGQPLQTFNPERTTRQGDQRLMVKFTVTKTVPAILTAGVIFTIITTTEQSRLTNWLQVILLLRRNTFVVRFATGRTAPTPRTHLYFYTPLAMVRATATKGVRTPPTAGGPATLSTNLNRTCKTTRRKNRLRVELTLLILVVVLDVTGPALSNRHTTTSPHAPSTQALWP